MPLESRRPAAGRRSPGCRAIRPGEEFALRPVRSVRALELVALERYGKRHVAVADEDERRLGQLERRQRRLSAEHVLPDGIARARVKELRLVKASLRLEALEPAPRLLVENVASSTGPPRSRPG